MAKKGLNKQVRERIAQEAARIMSEEGVNDHYIAKSKAAQRLGMHDGNGILPSNAEIEQALIQYQSLFKQDTQPQYLQELRKVAVKAMRLLTEFEPRLVGSVLNGTADQYSPVQIQLYTDVPEHILLFLADRNIRCRQTMKRLRYNAKDEPQQFPCYCFLAKEIEVELTILPYDNLRQAPRNPVDGKPMQRASLNEVEFLLEMSSV